MDTEVIKRSLGESETPPKRKSFNLKGLNNPEWITVHSGPNRAERRKHARNSNKAAKKAKREEKRLGQ